MTRVFASSSTWPRPLWGATARRGRARRRSHSFFRPKLSRTGDSHSRRRQFLRGVAGERSLRWSIDAQGTARRRSWMTAKRLLVLCGESDRPQRPRFDRGGARSRSARGCSDGYPPFGTMESGTPGLSTCRVRRAGSRASLVIAHRHAVYLVRQSRLDRLVRWPSRGWRGPTQQSRLFPCLGSAPPRVIGCPATARVAVASPISRHPSHRESR